MQRPAIPAGLLDAVKNYLDITWADEQQNEKTEELIRSAMAYLNKKRGAEADFAEAGMPRTLLLEYVRYARDAALDVFENNYRSLIIDMQNERRVAEYVESTEQAET